jgi:membrane protein implicated in regulation of membrane protease activity
MKKEVIEKISALIIAAFGLIAALAWNEAIKALFVGPCGVENAGALCRLSGGGPWVYAIIVTIIAVLATIWIGKAEKAAGKVKSPLKKKEKEKKSKKK